MKRKQRNIYSLLGRIGSELTDEAQREGNSRDEGRDSPEGGVEKSAKGVVPEGPDASEPNDHMKGKARDFGDRTSSTFTDRKVCPQCKKAGLVRVRRLRWMRLILKSQHYLCLECEAKFLVVGRLKIELRKGQA
jgi:hypothetical protein